MQGSIHIYASLILWHMDCFILGQMADAALSSDELEVLDYLKSWNGKSVSMVEICRCAGGRQKFKESPNWARPMMSRLVELGLVAVNERGHYRWLDLSHAPKAGRPVLPLPKMRHAPATPKAGTIVGDDYFPSSNSDAGGDADAARWV